LPDPQPDLYLDLLKHSVTASLYPESGWRVVTGFRPGRMTRSARVRRWAIRRLRRQGLMLIRPTAFDASARAVGHDWPCFGYSMVGTARLNHLHACIDAVLRDNVPGDLLEAGVWLGGCTIFMQGMLVRKGVTNRRIWVADSFEGLPPPRSDVDRALTSYDLSWSEYLAVGVDEVRANFARFGLLHDNVSFLKGWFSNTLRAAPIQQLALLRLDADLYESTMDVLTALYSKVSRGGFVIVDDYHSWPGCRQAVDEYRRAFDVTAPLLPIDEQAVWWRVS